MKTYPRIKNNTKIYKFIFGILLFCSIWMFVLPLSWGLTLNEGNQLLNPSFLADSPFHWIQSGIVQMQQDPTLGDGSTITLIPGPRQAARVYQYVRLHRYSEYQLQARCMGKDNAYISVGVKGHLGPWSTEENGGNYAEFHTYQVNFNTGHEENEGQIYLEVWQGEEGQVYCDYTELKEIVK